jgi:hypothetical protein
VLEIHLAVSSIDYGHKQISHSDPVAWLGDRTVNHSGPLPRTATGARCWACDGLAATCVLDGPIRPNLPRLRRTATRRHAQALRHRSSRTISAPTSRPPSGRRSRRPARRSGTCRFALSQDWVRPRLLCMFRGFRSPPYLRQIRTPTDRMFYRARWCCASSSVGISCSALIIGCSRRFSYSPLDLGSFRRS